MPASYQIIFYFLKETQVSWNHHNDNDCLFAFQIFSSLKDPSMIEILGNVNLAILIPPVNF